MSGRLTLPGVGAAYIRVSTDQQDTLRQYEAVRAFAERHDVTILPQHWYEDHGWARDTADRRPAFQRVLGEAEAGRVQWIVVDKLDRFGAKSPKQLMVYLYRLEEAGCRLYDAEGKEWTGEDVGTDVMAFLEGYKSKGEQTDKSYRVLGAKVAYAKAGDWMGGSVRLGFDVACYSKPTGAELWRVVFEGIDQAKEAERRRSRGAGAAKEKSPPLPLKRLKVYPDGKTERFDGPNNFPKFQEEVERLQVAPSRDKAKVDAAVNVFKRFAGEAVSPTTLAQELTKLGFRTAWGGPFQGHHVRSMLLDPIYIGCYTYNRQHYGKFHRFKDGKVVQELNYEERQSPNAKGDWVQSPPLFEPLVDREIWDEVQRKLGAPRRETAPRSPALYLAGLVVCGNCGSRMIAGRGRSLKDRRGLPRFEFQCGSYHRAIRNKQRQATTCLRNGVFQHSLEPYIERWLEETGRRLDLLTRGRDVVAPTGRLEGQEADGWNGFRDGLARVMRYLAEHQPGEYDRILQVHDAQRTAEEAECEEPTRLPAGTLAEHLGERGRETWEAAKQSTDPPGHDDFVAKCLACYRQHFDPAGLAAEVAKLEAEHTTLMRQWADLPTPRAKEKAKAELAELEARIAEMERQQQDAAGVVEHYHRQMNDLQRAIANAKAAMRSEAGEHALRRKADALRSIIQRIECRFVATGETYGTWGKRTTRLTQVTIYPVVGEAAHFSADILLRATRATAPDLRNTILRLLTIAYPAA